MQAASKKIALRFKNEKLGAHWRVDHTRESFEGLLYHLDVRTNMKPFFEEALEHLKLDGDAFPDNLVAADIGAGVSWASAMLANHPKIKRVYAVDPSDNRLRHAKFVIRHFGVEDKVELVKGTFLKPEIPEKADLILFCGAFHHCYDKYVPALLKKVKDLLRPGGRVLIANEHYVNWIWSLRRLLSCSKRLFGGSKDIYWSIGNLRKPDPFGGDHWRTRKEIEKMFCENGFRARIFTHKKGIGKNSLYYGLGWKYYCAILEVKEGIGK